MDISNESRLQHEGARAAAQGRSWRTNPILQACNMPQATGESLGDWSCQHDAWQRGFEAHFQAGADIAQRRSEKISADVLKTLVQRRLPWLPAVRARAVTYPQLLLKLASPRRPLRGDTGRDLNLEDSESVAAGIAEIDAELRSIVERSRRQYDTLAPATALSMAGGIGPCASAGAPSEGQQLSSDEPSPERSGRTDTIAAAMALHCGATPQQGLENPSEAAGPSALSNDPRIRIELGIRRIGWRYEYQGYRYDRLADAVAYATLNRNTSRCEAAPGGAQCFADVPPPMPSREDQLLMARWSVEFDKGIYKLKSYRYERLSDAVAHALLLASRPR